MPAAAQFCKVQLTRHIVAASMGEALMEEALSNAGILHHIFSYEGAGSWLFISLVSSYGGSGMRSWMLDLCAGALCAPQYIRRCIAQCFSRHRASEWRASMDCELSLLLSNCMM
jgi:hypothetical protein